MAKKTSEQQSSSAGRDQLDGFRQRLPQRLTASDASSHQIDPVQRDHINTIKARMAAAKSDVTSPLATRLQRATAAPIPASTPPSAPIDTPEDAPVQIETPKETPIAAAPNEAPIDAPVEPSSGAEEMETNDGFQIFKARSVPHKPALVEPSAPEASTAQNDVEPVPMAPDAIEDALKLIEEEDEQNNASSETPAIGFTPSNLIDDDPAPALDPDTNDDSGTNEDDFPIGVFGASAPSNQNQLTDNDADHTDHKSDDTTPDAPTPEDMELAAALSAEFAQMPASSPETEANVSVLDEDHRRNIDIGRNMASSIKSIIRDEVDETLDRIARQAVRDALKAHRAL